MKYRLLKHSSIYLYAVMAVCSLGIISVPGDCVVINNDSSLNVYNPFDDPHEINDWLDITPFESLLHSLLGARNEVVAHEGVTEGIMPSEP